MKNVRPKKILIPVDFSATSHKAFHHARSIAEKFGSEITLMHVLEDWPFSGVFPFFPDDSNQVLRDTYEKKALAQLEELKSELLAAGISVVNIQYSEGSMSQCVNEVVKETGIDLVVMGTHGSKAAPGLFMGSNAFKVVSSLTIPVLTVHEKASFGPYKNIVTTLDDTHYSRAKFPYIASLAKTFGSNVEILYPASSSSEVSERLEKHFNQVSAFLESQHIVHVSREIEGHFAHEVIKFAEYTNCDLVVIMSETESTISGLLMGSTAHEIITHSNAPVLTLHPHETAEFSGNFF